MCRRFDPGSAHFLVFNELHKSPGTPPGVFLFRLVPLPWHAKLRPANDVTRACSAPLQRAGGFTSTDRHVRPAPRGRPAVRLSAGWNGAPAPARPSAVAAHFPKCFFLTLWHSHGEMSAPICSGQRASVQNISLRLSPGHGGRAGRKCHVHSRAACARRPVVSVPSQPQSVASRSQSSRWNCVRCCRSALSACRTGSTLGRSR